MSRFARLFAERLAPHVGLTAEELLPQIGAPPRPELGQLAFGCFALAKAQRKAPPAIAAELAGQVQTGGVIRSVAAAGPYVNATLDGAAVAAAVLPEALARGDAFGTLDLGAGAAAVVDYSSPNIAKPFAIHHLRSTVIGHALLNMLTAAGYKPVGINHLGDWGTQFGQLLAIWEVRGDEAELQKRGIAYLLELYVDFNARKKERPELQDVARAKFKLLEDGDPQARRLWKLFREVSMAEFERVYALLGIRFDDLCAARASSRKSPRCWTSWSGGPAGGERGRTCVDLTAEGQAHGLVRQARRHDAVRHARSRGRSTRAGRSSISSVPVRRGRERRLHFRQLKAVLEALGREWEPRVEHVAFGLMRSRTRKIASARATVLLLEDVLDAGGRSGSETIARGVGREGPAELG